MLDRRTRTVLGQAMVILFGPLCLLTSLLLVSQSAGVVSEMTMTWSYLAFMLGLALIAGGAFLWARNR